MSGRLNGRVAIVVGGALGIGKGIAERFAEEGATIVLADSNEELGRATLAGLQSSRKLFQRADVTSEEDMSRLAERTAKEFGRIDVLVQNAGIYPFSLIENTSEPQWDRVFSVNMKGTFFAAKACLPYMRDQREGRMIFTSSITGARVVSHGLSSYAATKAGINGFIKAAALEFASHGITVNGVEPGNIVTEGLLAGRSPQFIASMERSIPLGRLGTPHDVANAVVFLASREASYITGTTIVVDGGQTLPENRDFFDPSTWA
ncbi:MAG: SDR family NAD(P)-dependent oxidoreductase [Parvibaculaceae bacterium]